MLPPCFTLADSVFPLVRQRASRLLAEQGVTQAEIGRRLGVSQAMVSKYLRAEMPEAPEGSAWIVEEMAEQAAAGADMMGVAQEPGQPNPWCRTFAQTLGPGAEAARATVAETTQVLLRLADAPMAPLVPAVNVNVAGILPDGSAREHVAAFPGRLALVRGRMRAHGPPEFGSSNHLAGVLLQARAEDATLRFVVNLRGDAAALSALRRAGEQAAKAAPDQRDADGVPSFRLDGAQALIDPGGHGIEPAVYLFDARPGQLADRVRRIAEACR